MHPVVKAVQIIVGTNQKQLISFFNHRVGVGNDDVFSTTNGNDVDFEPVAHVQIDDCGIDDFSFGVDDDETVRIVQVDVIEDVVTDDLTRQPFARL